MARRYSICKPEEYRFEPDDPYVYRFVPPREAPVYEPTMEEFEHPYRYIESIKESAQKFGIIRIKAPMEWQPPFAVDMDSFRFKTRIQRINELEARTRIKLCFLEQIKQFWDLQGFKFEHPVVHDKEIDLYVLYHLVEKEGGYQVCTDENKWPKIASLLKVPKFFAKLVAAHYKNILYPFAVYEENKLQKHSSRADTQSDNVTTISASSQEKFKKEAALKEAKRRNSKPRYVLYKEETRKVQGKPGATLKHPKSNNSDEKLEEKVLYKFNYEKYNALLDESKRPIKIKVEPVENSSEDDTEDDTYSPMELNPEECELMEKYEEKPQVSTPMKRTKTSDSHMSKVPRIKIKSEPVSDGESRPSRSRAKRRSSGNNRKSAVLKPKVEVVDPLAKYICLYCKEGDREEFMLLCDGCDDSYHTFCLKPPLSEVPKGDWRCPKCVEEHLKQSKELFGFATSEKEYLLKEFGDKADEFKDDYFRNRLKPGSDLREIPEKVVEQEFWRVVSTVQSNVVVEYGADIHSLEYGSGFPSTRHVGSFRDPEIPKYLVSPWNLNNMPVLKESLLGYVKDEIPGMKVPWMYVGMCFSTFCWHNEDHWSYSINYLHWGDPKTWYGVPGSYADKFEEVMAAAVPELFDEQPDLLHQLTTILNPNILMSAGVPVFRTDQQAGEFVITFPRAYHAGFNQGYNFAEAVNFTPYDWLPLGRKSIEHYSNQKRQLVFSQDELICNICIHADNDTDRILAGAVYLDFCNMVQEESKWRRTINAWGVYKFRRFAFERLPDDERQCAFCKTTLYMSAVTCLCQKKKEKQKMVCLRHYKELCFCPPSHHTLRFRWNMFALPVAALKLKYIAHGRYNHFLCIPRDVLYASMANAPPGYYES